MAGEGHRRVIKRAGNKQLLQAETDALSGQFRQAQRRQDCEHNPAVACNVAHVGTTKMLYFLERVCPCLVNLRLSQLAGRLK